MYSEDVIGKKLEYFTRRKGWTPAPHTLGEVEDFNKYIESIVKIESNNRNSYISIKDRLSGRRQKEVKRWIENEQIMCSVSSAYFESRYAFITNECGEKIKFQNRKAQELFDNILADLEDKGLAMELLVMNSRQTGLSTKSVLKIMHRVLFTPNNQALMTSGSILQRNLTQRTINTLYDSLPWWLAPRKTPKASFSNGSVVSMQSGNTLGLSTGYTPQSVLIPDVDKIKNPMIVIEEGLLRAVQSSPRTLMILHGSVGESATSWFGSTWESSRKYWPEGKSRLCPIFIPWYAASDIYPSPDWIKKHPIPDGWVPMNKTIEHAEDASRYVSNIPYLRNELGDQWVMPEEQKWLWEHGYLDAQEKKMVDKYTTMMAANDEEAFVSHDEVDLDNMFPDASKTQKLVFQTEG